MFLDNLISYIILCPTLTLLLMYMFSTGKTKSRAEEYFSYFSLIVELGYAD